MRIFYKLAWTSILVVIVSGCAPMAITGSADVNKQAFGPKKKFAVVSIASMKTFHGEQGLGQMFTKNDDIPGMNTQPIINKLDSKIIRSLDNDKHISLLPEKAVLTSKAYKRLAEDDRVMKVLFMNETMNVANNYKYVSDEKKYAELARELGVDGVIGITVNFSIMSSKGTVSVMGLSAGRKSYSASAAISAVAYNKDGEVIWKDSTIKEADPGDTKAIILLDTTDMTGTDFEKFHPSAVEIGGKAVDVLLARLDDTMAGKEVSSIQSFK
ncbi:MAG TPA: hypothetical protein VMJ33_09560 [Gallionella sp.]|nr:hypothetical protein [Gallionella sp.]